MNNEQGINIIYKCCDVKNVRLLFLVSFTLAVISKSQVLKMASRVCKRSEDELTKL